MTFDDKAVNGSAPQKDSMTSEQRKAFNRIRSLIKENFKVGLVSVVFKATDGTIKIEASTNAATKRSAIDIARRTLQEIEVLETGIIRSIEFDK